MGIGGNWPSNGLFMALHKAGYKINDFYRGYVLTATNGHIRISIHERVLDMGAFSTRYNITVNGKQTSVPDMDEDGWTLWLTKLELKGGL